MRPAVLRNQQVHVFFPPPHSARAMNANYVRSAKRDRWLGDTHFPRLILGVSFLSRIVRVPWNHWENTFAFLCRSEPSRAESSYGRSKIERDKSQRETLKFNERESGKVGVIVADYWRKRRGITWYQSIQGWRSRAKNVRREHSGESCRDRGGRREDFKPDSLSLLTVPISGKEILHVLPASFPRKHRLMLVSSLYFIYYYVCRSFSLSLSLSLSFLFLIIVKHNTYSSDRVIESRWSFVKCFRVFWLLWRIYYHTEIHGGDYLRFATRSEGH